MAEEQKDKAADDRWLNDVDFMMYQFKVTLCNRHCDHDWDTCPYAHIGERTCRRRDPAKVNYTSTICVDMMQKGRCPRGRSCNGAHTIYEYWLHPHRYRTEMCKVGPNCSRRICFFAHKPEELRPLPPHLIGTSGGGNAGKYSLSATRQAAAAAAAAAAGARPKMGVMNMGMGYMQPTAAHAFPQQAAYSRMDQASWGVNPQAGSVFSVDSASYAGGLLFPDVMHRSTMQPQQPAVMGTGGLGLLSAGDPAGWQQQQPSSGVYSGGVPLAGDRSLLSQLQQLGLTGSAPNTPPAISAPMAATGGMHSFMPAAQWNDPVGLAAGSGADLVAGQQLYAGDALLQGWQQQQQQQQQPTQLLQGPSQAFAGSHTGLPASSRVLVLQQPQQPQQLMQLLGAQNMGFAKAMGPGQAIGVGAAFQPVKVSASSAMAHPGQLAMGQGPWML